jgi:hypothetical protein
VASGSILIWAGSIAAVAAVGLLRLGWGRRTRSRTINGAAWALLLAGVVVAGMGGGAWGVALAALCAMLLAFAVLAVAGIRSPERRAKASNRRVGMLPEKGEPRRIGRRLVTFLLTIVAGFAVSIGLGLAMRGLGGVLGWSEANANVLALYTVPVAWSVLAFALLMQQTRRSQVLTLLACAVPVVPVLLSGVVT